MKQIELDISGLSINRSQKDTFILILTEKYGDRQIPIIIGSNEAQAIAIELENITPPRPLTHDLFKNIAIALEYTITEVWINKYDDGIFYSKLIITQNDKTIEVDARTSDAIAIAVRFNCPIYTNEDIVTLTGIAIDSSDEENCEASMTQEELEIEEKRLDYIFDTLEELEEKLSKAIEIEDYETASIIRDEIRSRQKE